jgi:hypothetical protein
MVMAQLRPITLFCETIKTSNTANGKKRWGPTKYTQ